MKLNKTAIITDLDNTLFDWVDLWVNCFSAMLHKIEELSQVPRASLLPEIAAVHQKHGTSEYSFLIEELPSLQKAARGIPILEFYRPAILAYQEERRNNLKLYPGVAETILKIKGSGAKIIGYTESMAFYSNYRVKRLGLDGVFDHIFCPEDHLLPDNISSEDIRKYPANQYSFQYTRQNHTPRGSKKPNTGVLETIIQSLRLDKSRTAYIGDSLMKDIAMANDCGIDSVWAKYGTAHTREEYELLKAVTHWTPAEVQKEQLLKAREHVHPTFIADSSFAQLCEFFTFSRFSVESK